ncbi:ATP-binding protein [Actinoplanes sp. URMC 104]|uniref:ATP-binding protein n=1 Tax=Actinoplanes sp. URMC 104 TaxID=3423409 RepID=UPI003F1ACFFF
MSALVAHLDVPPGPGGTTAARTAARTVLQAWGFRDADWLYDATVVVSELVANAVRHGGGILALTLHAVRGRVTVIAADCTGAPPRRRRGDQTGGRGLAIIETLSRAWGVQPYGRGKCVWVLLPACDGR